MMVVVNLTAQVDPPGAWCHGGQGGRTSSSQDTPAPHSSCYHLSLLGGPSASQPPAVGGNGLIKRNNGKLLII